MKILSSVLACLGVVFSVWGVALFLLSFTITDGNEGQLIVGYKMNGIGFMLLGIVLSGMASGANTLAKMDAQNK